MDISEIFRNKIGVHVVHKFVVYNQKGGIDEALECSMVWHAV